MKNIFAFTMLIVAYLVVGGANIWATTECTYDITNCDPPKIVDYVIPFSERCQIRAQLSYTNCNGVITVEILAMSFMGDNCDMLGNDADYWRFLVLREVVGNEDPANPGISQVFPGSIPDCSSGHGEEHDTSSTNPGGTPGDCASVIRIVSAACYFDRMCTTTYDRVDSVLCNYGAPETQHYSLNYSVSEVLPCGDAKRVVCYCICKDPTTGNISIRDIDWQLWPIGARCSKEAAYAPNECRYSCRE